MLPLTLKLRFSVKQALGFPKIENHISVTSGKWLLESRHRNLEILLMPEVEGDLRHTLEALSMLSAIFRLFLSFFWHPGAFACDECLVLSIVISRQRKEEESCEIFYFFFKSPVDTASV